MRAFGAAADPLVSASQGTCGVGHPRSDEVLIDDLGVGGGVSEPAIPECRLRLLDGNPPLLPLVVCPYPSSFLTHRAEVEGGLRCHVDGRYSSAEWQLTSASKVAVSYRT